MKKCGGSFFIIVLLIFALFLFPLLAVPPVSADLGPVNYSMTHTALFVKNDTDLYFYDVSVQMNVAVFRYGYHTYQYFVWISSHFSLTTLASDGKQNKTLGFFYPHTWSWNSNSTTNPFTMTVYVNSSKVDYVLVPGRNIVSSSNYLNYLMGNSDVAIFNVTLSRNEFLTVDVVCTYSVVVSTSSYYISYIIATSKTWYVNPLEKDTIERITAQIYHPEEVNVSFTHPGKLLKSNSVYKKYLWEIDISKNTWNDVAITFRQYPYRYRRSTLPVWLEMIEDGLVYFKEHILAYLILIYFVLFSLVLYKKQSRPLQPKKLFKNLRI